MLHRPEIPNNTGNIGRTCVAMGCALRLIHPLGFSLAERARRRASLDYWPRLRLAEHDDWAAYLSASAEVGGRAAEGRRPRRWLLTSKAATPLYRVPLRRGDHLVFGGESRGLPDAILEAEPDAAVCLPMLPGERSLNLATAVCAALAEGVRQLDQRGYVAVRGGRLDPGAAAGPSA